ncbi:MAG: hypothetical protein AB7J35_00490 [Dehalococcoidia bacterium]
MTWVRLDDQILDHPKFISLDNDALVLWLLCLTYSNAQRTDGALSDAVVRTLAARRNLTHVDPGVLVDAGLWERQPAGYLIHDYHDYQPAKSSLERERVAAAERKRRQRSRKSPGVTRHDVTGTGREDDDDFHIQEPVEDSSSSPVTAMSHRDIAVTLSGVFRELTGLRTNGAVVNDIEQFLEDGVTPEAIEERIGVCARAGAESWRYVAKAIEQDHQPSRPRENPFKASKDRHDAVVRDFLARSKDVAS